MSENVRHVPAEHVKTGDRLALTGRIVTQVTQTDDHVVLHHGPTARTLIDHGSVVRVCRPSREEHHAQPTKPDSSHLWYVERRRT